MKIGKYRHYSGHEYEVLGKALNTETREWLAVYRPLYPVTDLGEEFENNPIFVRPAQMFEEEVEVDGKMVPRFAFIQ